MSLKILIAGQEGMVGKAVYKLLKKKKFRIIECKRNQLDFTSQQSVENWFKKKKPDIVINAAGRVGGILDNFNFQSDYIYINTMIGMFKDTSLVIVIALFDLMGTAKASLADSNWLGFSIEAYVFIALIYFLICFSMGQFSKNVEEKFRLEKERGK